MQYTDKQLEEMSLAELEKAHKKKVESIKQLNEMIDLIGKIKSPNTRIEGETKGAVTGFMCSLGNAIRGKDINNKFLKSGKYVKG